MTTSMNGATLVKGTEWLGPLFGEAWAEQPLDLFSDRIKGLAATGLLNPRGLTSGETQALAAAVMAYVVANAR